MGKKIDRRIQKTRETIKNAFIELLNEKGFWNTSVNEVAERADINRGTFYLHYQDKFDLFEKYVDELLSELTSQIKPLNQEKDQRKNEIEDNDNNIYELFFKHFQEYSSFYKPILSFKGGPYFYTRFIEIIKEFYLQQYTKLPYNQKLDKEILINFVAHAQLGVISSWIQEDMTKTPEYMGEQLSVLFSSFLRST
ncbi:TetR/AcrR family transcriptional regulator [Staphylococcus arlettae]|uniref:TetR/AcrR family transcriptional regulator n=1 Tax=Staphylococcus TaxID=1279 RepID=UPI001AEC3B90|nr:MULTISPECIES: TetR/AcrR family transcriptional regulator [Staphylococcus]MCD8888041.1 TetR/AcrR family transcriptional regulator [Staphylococcus arlettae]MCD8907673.1 TetR/AcrR family transcriptional regulator [Staphylococcus arlettae]MCE4985203.1 TetR/AcrR family transcriptional regulator [Staphylococcus arlettae]MEB7421367.1 TetR/AcrR family transcriptional regulator [Staphylococcus arlettae]